MVKIIDATNLILGRLATYSAKQALLGEKVILINCDKIIISGGKKSIFGEYLHSVERGHALSGPHYPKETHMIMKRTIRGMLPRNGERGRKALSRILCFKGVPAIYADQKIETVQTASVERLGTGKYITLKMVSERLGHNE